MIPKMVLERGKTLLNIPDTDGMTPLHVAVVENHFAVAVSLIEAKADVTAVDNQVSATRTEYLH